MKALDTNVLVRYLVADDPTQASQVRELFRAAELDREALFVPSVVLLETIWVLRSVYEVPRDGILGALESLGRLPFLKFERPQLVRRLVNEGRSSRVDLADLCIGLSAAEAGCAATLTFDRRLGKEQLFEVIGGKKGR